MTSASFFSPHRGRTIALCGAVVALHWLLILYAGDRLGPLREVMRHERTQLVTATLIMAPAPRPVALPPPAPAPRPKPPRKVAPEPAMPEAAQTMDVAALTPAPPSASGAQPETAPDTPADAPAGPAVTGPALAPPASAPADTTPAPPPVPAVEGARRYNVNLPPPADFDMQVARVDSDGTRWSGVAAMTWRNDGSHYKVTLEAGLSMLVTRINLLVLTSEGEIDDAGIAPMMATEKRKGRSLTATHFRRGEKRITFSSSEASYPLMPGTQDKASLPFQLAGIGRADVNQLAGDIDIWVGEDKEANVFRFRLVGEEELETKMGRLVTWHLSRPPKPGTYSSKLDIWLAPGLNWYPVQIRNTEASGALTTQTVSKINN